MLSSKEKLFVSGIKHACKQYNINCDLRKSSYIKSGPIKCSGWFDADSHELVVAIKNKNWLYILAHEYCHMLQWVDNTEIWKKGIRACGYMHDFLSTERNIDRYIDHARDLELDCEKRTVKLLEDWDFGINMEEYIQKANAYIQFYNYLKITRKWSKPGNAPYENKTLWCEMPKKFNMNYNKLSKKNLKLFKDCNI